MTQNQMILNHLEEHGSITSLEAMTTYGIMRLASRISDLRRKGYNISSTRIKVLNRRNEACWVSKYELV